MERSGQTLPDTHTSDVLGEGVSDNLRQDTAATRKFTLKGKKNIHWVTVERVYNSENTAVSEPNKSSKLVHNADEIRRAIEREKPNAQQLKALLKRLSKEGLGPTNAETKCLSGAAVSADSTLLPEKAPELYKERSDRSEEVVAFVKRVYGAHIGHGLTRPLLSRLDPPLVRAIDYRKSLEEPEALALDLPTAWVAPQKWADRVLAGEEVAPVLADEKTHRRNRQRLASARERQSREDRNMSAR